MAKHKDKESYLICWFVGGYWSYGFKVYLEK